MEGAGVSALIHQFWHDGSPPDQLKPFIKTWQSDEDAHVLWSLEDVREQLPETKPLMKLARLIWGNSQRAHSDIARIAILKEYGGLYVDADCEKVGDVWQKLESASVGHQLVTVRPERQRQLDHERCCNGIIYARNAREPVLSCVWDAMHARLDLIETQVRMSGKKPPRPVDACGPMMLWFMQRTRESIGMIDAPWAAFAGVEKPESEIVIHQRWRNL